MGKTAERRLGAYALLHFFVDFACILLLCGPVRQELQTHAEWALCMLLYNGCAFALQMPFGVLADHVRNDRLTAALGMLLAAIAWLMPVIPGVERCAIAGIGNALFHVGGGRYALAYGSGCAAAPGIFVSTGAVGVWLGVWAARGGLWPYDWTRLAVGLTMLAAAFLVYWKADAAEPSVAAPSAPARWPRTGAAGLCLLLTVLLRSFLGGLTAFPWKTGALSFACVLCVAAGKAAGGLLGDRCGFARTSALALCAAAALFLPAFSVPAAGLFAVLLFQTSMPLTLSALTRLVGLQNRGFAFGMATFAIFLGTLPDLLGVADAFCTPVALAAGTLLSLALLLPGLGLGFARRREETA